MRSKADPALDYFGPAELSHPQELKAIKEDLESSGVRINVRDKDHPAIGYGPSSIPGEPGSMTVTEGMSFSAWKHEHRHFSTDRELGYPGHVHYYGNLELYAEMEREAYGEEVALARENGYNELAKIIENIRDSAISEILQGELF